MAPKGLRFGSPPPDRDADPLPGARGGREQPERVSERRQQCSGDRVRGGRARAKLRAEGQDFAFAMRHVEGPERPVPDRQAVAEIAIEMDRVRRVVDLMVRRADEDAPEAGAETDPDVGMLQMNGREDED